MADVFISYKSERRAAAEHLAEILADYGYSVWWDYGLISGRDFGAQIEKELRDAKAVVVLWCSLSTSSEWVREEAALAKRLSKVIPTFIEKVDLPLGFSLSQTLDLSDWDGAPQSNRLERLLRDVAQLVGRAPKPNLEGLDRTERAWRRFGAPPLVQFALIDALERRLPPRTLPVALHPQAEREAESVHTTKAKTNEADDPKPSRKGLVVGGLLGATLLVAAIGFIIFGGVPAAIERTEPTVAPPLHAGAEFDDCGGESWCPRMIVVAADSYTMGSPEGELGRDSDEGPQRRVAVGEFAAGKYEITFDEWAACTNGGGCTSNSNPSDQGWGRGSRPVINVSWDDAQQYVQWLSQETGRNYRLLTETEWEYVARAGTTTTYSWGPQASHDFANYGDEQGSGGIVQGRDQWVHSAPVGSFQANQFGLYDTSGNVWEWVQDCYAQTLNDLPLDGSALSPLSCERRVGRGGFWGVPPVWLRIADRRADPPATRMDGLGFRVARTLE